MLGHVLLGLLLLGLSAGPLYAVLAPFRKVWQGDASRVPKPPQVPVNARSYLAFLLWFVPLFTGMGLMAVTLIVGAFLDNAKAALFPLFRVSVVLILGAPPLTLVQWFVSAFARPKFLIPPPYRDQPGSFSQARERRRRKRSGLPPTDHVVEIVHALPDAPDTGLEPYWSARCTDRECDWAVDTDDKLIGVPPEEQLRAKAAQHTTAIAPGVRRPLG